MASEGRKAYIESLLRSWRFCENDIFLLSEQIYSIGETIGFIGSNLSSDPEKNRQRYHKYDTWIAKEVHNTGVSILKQTENIHDIIDWAASTKANIFNYNFAQAFEAQKEWHDKLSKNTCYKNIKIPVIDNSRIVFAFSDDYHFLYLLVPEELSYEGKKMGHCVGGQNYKNAIKSGNSLILSLRDMGNKPFCTIEIDARNKTISQIRGRANKIPESKYLTMLEEFVLYASDYPSLKEKETLDFLNLSQHFKE